MSVGTSSDGSTRQAIVPPVRRRSRAATAAAARSESPSTGVVTPMRISVRSCSNTDGGSPESMRARTSDASLALSSTRIPGRDATQEVTGVRRISAAQRNDPAPRHCRSAFGREPRRRDRANRCRASGAARGRRRRGHTRGESEAARRGAGSPVAAADRAPPRSALPGVGGSGTVPAVSAADFFGTLESRADPAKLAGVDNSYLFDIEGEGQWFVRVAGGSVSVTPGGGDGADATITASGETFEKIVSGEQNPTTAYMTGKLKIKGDIGAAMKLQKLF